ncbi:MAG: YggS family pyridoxal phosphate-dependent enzyme [Woeseiaceae bacterium]|nr:YggS family pyridoxal phosphate-dependent enzyme [Woeseiaceae bacterium]
MIKVTENLRKIQDLLRAEADAAGRVPESVKLLAVSKRKPVEAILEAASAGQRDFGENFAQEGVDKIDGTGRDDLTWHFIGHLQSNKTRLVAERYDWVHTIDRIKIARRLSQQRPHHAGDLNVCIQVNIDDEQSKSGIRPEDVEAMASEIAALPKLKLRGLMCIPAVQSGMDAQRKPFAALRRLLESLQQQGLELDTLSMGMSADYPAAIREGATIVRIGTLLFGERDG